MVKTDFFVEISDKYFRNETHGVVWAANKSRVKFPVDGGHAHLHSAHVCYVPGEMLTKLLLNFLKGLRWYLKKSHHKELLCQEGVKVLHGHHIQVDREPVNCHL